MKDDTDIKQRAADVWGIVTDRVRVGARATWAVLTAKGKLPYALGVLGVIALGLIYLSLQLAGVLATILYVFLFLVGSLGIPSTILLMGPSFFGFVRSTMGKLHFILGQMAFGTGYLVQRVDKWEMCPGTSDAVFVDDSWHHLEGRTNKSVLGWQPFGIVRFKTEQTLQEARVDPKNLAINDDGITQTDGGNSVDRANYGEIPPDPSVTGDTSWLLDLKRVFTNGVKQMGDISLIEKAEEVTMRKESKDGRTAGWEPIIGSLVGIVLGVATGYVMLGGV